MSVNYAIPDDPNTMVDWCDKLYAEWFGDTFSDTKHLFTRLRSKNHPITDAELESILIDLPITLFYAAESLNHFRVQYEVFRLKLKESEYNLIPEMPEKALTKKQEHASIAVTDKKIIAAAYASILARVGQEIEFCQELIMGAKKIWDGRRKGEIASPVSPADELPRHYVKGAGK